MKTKLLLTTLFGVAAWSLSSLAMANWNTGPCTAGAAPCIETEINGNIYHFNGSGGHAGVWHGRPAAEGGGDFEFSGDNVALDCPDQSVSCTLSLSGQVKKCLDSDENWRIGVKVTGADVSAGDFLCSLLTVSGFPWYSKDPTIASHCHFEDNCDTFIPYVPDAASYTANFGNVTVSSFLDTYVDNEHLHGVVFTPGANATFDFTNKTFYSCDEDAGCSIDGILELNNADALNVY